jgi:hypothetical protein
MDKDWIETLARTDSRRSLHVMNGTSRSDELPESALIRINFFRHYIFAAWQTEALQEESLHYG